MILRIFIICSFGLSIFIATEAFAQHGALSETRLTGDEAHRFLSSIRELAQLYISQENPWTDRSSCKLVASMGRSWRPTTCVYSNLKFISPDLNTFCESGISLEGKFPEVISPNEVGYRMSTTELLEIEGRLRAETRSKLTCIVIDN